MLAERLIANLVNNAVRYNLAAADIWIATRTMAGGSQPAFTPPDGQVSHGRADLPEISGSIPGIPDCDRDDSLARISARQALR